MKQKTMRFMDKETLKAIDDSINLCNLIEKKIKSGEFSNKITKKNRKILVKIFEKINEGEQIIKKVEFL